MAKLTGPLMSMDATGQFDGTIVFSKWKGRNTVRQLVPPSNPRTVGQEDARNRTRVTGAVQKWINATNTKHAGATDLDKARIIAVTPSGFAWNGYLTQTLIGVGYANYDEAVAVWTALSPTDKTAWDDAAALLVPAIMPVNQTMAGGASDVPLTAGNIFFLAMYALFLIGLEDVPDATPPTYA